MARRVRRPRERRQLMRDIPSPEAIRVRLEMIAEEVRKLKDAIEALNRLNQPRITVNG
jgi:hypothetical protein